MRYQCPACTFAEIANGSSGCINRCLIASNRNGTVRLLPVPPNAYEVLCPHQGVGKNSDQLDQVQGHTSCKGCLKELELCYLRRVKSGDTPPPPLLASHLCRASWKPGGKSSSKGPKAEPEPRQRFTREYMLTMRKSVLIISY